MGGLKEGREGAACGQGHHERVQIPAQSQVLRRSSLHPGDYFEKASTRRKKGLYTCSPSSSITHRSLQNVRTDRTAPARSQPGAQEGTTQLWMTNDKQVMDSVGSGPQVGIPGARGHTALPGSGLPTSSCPTQPSPATAQLGHEVRASVWGRPRLLSMDYTPWRQSGGTFWLINHKSSHGSCPF